jgi:hypothetical protein
MFLWILLSSMQDPCANYVFICFLTPSAVTFTSFQISSVYETIKQRIEYTSWFSTKLVETLLIPRRTIEILRYKQVCFYKISDKLVEFQRNKIFLHRFPGCIQILNFIKFWRVKSELFVIRKTDIAEKRSKFVIFPNHVKSWVGFLVHFLRYGWSYWRFLLIINRETFQIISK